MPGISLTPALLIGLGLRILLDLLTRSGEPPSIRDHALVGAWQGLGFHYSLRYPNLSIIVAAVFLGKLFLEWHFFQDPTRTATTIFGASAGAISSEFLSQLFDPRQSSGKPEPSTRKRRVSTSVPRPQRDRIVQFEPGRHPNRSKGSIDTKEVPPVPNTISDITSIESSSEFIPSSLSPRERLEREIKMLRTRASLADSERRRFKEERKWALSAGNDARADQMKWQVKRYASLMENFHREADTKLLEASQLPTNDQPSQLLRANPQQPKGSAQQSRRRREVSTSETQHGNSNYYTDPGPSGVRRKAGKLPPRELIR